MGMTWSEYKAYREKKKKEEQEKAKAKAEKKQNSSNKTTNNNVIQKQTGLIKESSSGLNVNKNNLIPNTNTWQDIINKNNTSKIIPGNNNPLAKIVEEKNENNPLQKAIKEQQSKPKTNTQETTSTWDRIMDNARLGGYGGIVGTAQTGYRDIRDIDNAYTQGSSYIRNTLLSTLFGEQGANLGKSIDEKIYGLNEGRNKFYNYALDILNQEQQSNTQKAQQNVEEVQKTGDKVGTKFTQLAQSIGQNAVGMATTAVNPALGFTYYKMSSEASYYDDALNRGMTEDQAKAYSKIMSYVEAGTETLSAGNVIKGGKVLKATVTGAKTVGVKVGVKAGFNVLKEGAKEEVVSSFKNALKSYGIGIAEEAFQEGITEPLQELTAMATAGKDKADWSNMPQRIFNSAFDGALSSLVLAGSNMGISTCQGVVTKLNNNQQVNTQEFNQAVKDASKELDAGKILTDNFENEVNKVKTELQTQDNNSINQETKTSQNQTSQAQNDAKTQTTNNLAKVRQFYDEDTYNQMKNFIETAPSEEALNQINEDIKTETKNRLEETYKSERFTESQDRKRTYAQYQRQNNTTGINYDNSVVDNALDAVAPNRNGRRTVGQWKQVAEQIGLNATDLTKSQIDDIAYGSWFDLQPTKNITQYDNRTKEHKGFEKFTSDDWINTIYESAKGQKLQKLDTVLNEQYSLAEQPQQNNFKYEQTDNEKVNALYESTSKYFDDSQKTHNMLKPMEKIIRDKGYNITFDDTLGDNVNGRIRTNQDTGEIEIAINPNSNRKGEFIIGHELTHAIETDEMTKLVKQRMEKDGELRNAVEDLKKLYGTDDINAEVLADISGQLFGNQEFINNLSVEKPTLFKRIYDTIVSLANKITGNSSEALFIKDLKNKWEKAYRENTNNIKEEQYSIGGKKGMENAIKNNPQNSLMRYYYNKAQQMAKQNIDNETIRQQTNWFQDKNGDWKFEFSDKDMTLKNNIKLEDGHTYKLGNILKHDTLFEIYPELKDYKVKVKSMKGNVNGSFNKNTKTINLNKTKSKISKEGTLIHEIQHAIQNIEGFEGGKSAKGSKLAYYNSLGEIEADNTKQRFLQEKRGNLDRNKVAPESSKTNPRHRKLDNYLQNRTIIDKMKDGLYNYFDKLGLGGNISNENFEVDTENDIQNQEQDSGLVDGRRNLNENSEKSSFNLSENHKEQQNKIIQENNPMDKTLGEHTWINSANDIKTYQEAIDDFGGIDNITPDFTAEDVRKALDTGKITIYSSYPIEQGTFVTPSKMEAQSYAGRSQVYSKEVNLSDVAWIDEVQGQYAKVEPRNNNVTTDNQGNELNPNMQKWAKDSKARVDSDGNISENGNLATVYHTTTDKVAQFNEFNPVGTPYYRFGDQVVNYFTDSKDMSGSYSNNKYKTADTKKLNNINEANNYLKELNNHKWNENKYYIEKKGNSYYLKENSLIQQEALNFLNNLSNDEINQLRENIFINEEFKGTPYGRAFSWDKFEKGLQEKYRNFTDKYMGSDNLVDIQKRMIEYLENEESYNEDKETYINKYENEEQLLRNLKQDIQKKDWINNSNIQYEGYVNITNPYIIDAEGKNWDSVVSKLNKDIERNISEIKSDTKKVTDLINLQLESEKKYNQYNQNNSHEEYLLQARLVKDLERGLPLDVRNDIEDTYLFGFNFDDYATKTTKNKIDGKSLVKDLLTKYAEEHDANDIREFDTKVEKYGNLSLNDFLKQAHEAYNTDMKYGKEDAYFKSEVEKILNRDITKAFNDDFITGEQLYKLAKEGFSKNAVLDILGERQTTNDIVKQVIEMNKNGANYDGVIMKNVLDYGGNSKTREPANLYVTFNSNQFKAIDNPNPTSDPDIRYSKQNQSWQDYLEKNYKSEGTTTDLRDIRLPMKEKQEVKAPVKQENTKIKFDNEVMKTNSEIKGNSETNEKVAKILSEPTKNVKPEQRTWAILKANFIDKGAVFEKISQKTNNRDLQGKYDYTLTAGARGQYAIGNDRYVYSNGKKTLQSKSLTSIMDEVGENTQAFNEYMYHQLNVDRMTLDERFETENKPVFGESITADVSRAEIAKIEEQHPEFKEYANDVYKYLEANKQELVDRGVISQETSDFFKERYPHYVPIQRATRKGNSIDVALDTKRTGINSPIKKAKGGNQDINPLFQTMASQTLQTYRASARNNFGLELKNTLQQMNQLNENRAIADIDDIVDTMTNEEQNNELLQPGKKGENPTFTVFEDGKKITYDISQDMYDALKPKSEILNKLDNTKLAKTGRKISNFRRGVLTEYNPIFSITNAIKDAQDVLINSQHSAKTYAKFPEAYAQIVKKGYWYNEYIQNGGEQNSYFTEGDFENIKSSKLDKAKNVLKFPLEKISQVNNVIEMAPRLAEYIVSRQNGANIETAMLDASRVTTNFKAGGDITKFANRNGATFLNASIQGFQQQVRNIQEANMKGLKGWTNLALKYTVAGLPALLLNNLFWDDDDDYEQLQDYVKDNYYVIAKLPNGNFLRIPKGRMVATIQKVVSNANDFVKDGKINSDDVASTIWNALKENVSFGMDNLAPNNPVDNNILSPIIQVAQNKTWYGDDLVPQRLQDVPDAEQADESTDKLSRWLGEKLNVSPIKVNYLLDQYSGGIGDVLLPLGTPQAENNVIEDKFTTDPVMKSQYPSDFFSKVDELNVKHNSIKATDEDILKYKYISSVQQEVSSLYKQKREIQASDKNDATKKQELKEVQKQINELAKESLENVDNVKISGESATIGDKQYYKNNGTWTKLTDKEKEKLNGTSTSVYSDYKNAINGLSDKEKIQTLRDSNYSKSDKSNLYEKTISTDKYYSTLKKSGIDIDEYMDYKLAQSNGDFTADKKNGKTVYGSGKAKAIEYANKNITGYGNRLMVLGKQYSLTDSQRKDLSNYINKTFATQAERTEVYKQLKLNFVVNGNKVTYK